MIYSVKDFRSKTVRVFSNLIKAKKYKSDLISQNFSKLDPRLHSHSLPNIEGLDALPIEWQRLIRDTIDLKIVEGIAQENDYMYLWSDEIYEQEGELYARFNEVSVRLFNGVFDKRSLRLDCSVQWAPAIVGGRCFAVFSKETRKPEVFHISKRLVWRGLRSNREWQASFISAGYKKENQDVFSDLLVEPPLYPQPSINYLENI